MSCNKCEECFELKSKEGNIYWMSEVAELVNKSQTFLKKLDFKIQNNQGITFIAVANVKQFFMEYTDLLNQDFNEATRKDIKLHVQYPGEDFGFTSILGAKNLQRYINLIEDAEFFDIVNNKSLTSYFQPIIKAEDRSIYGYEALIRGVKNDGSLMFPDQLFAKSTRNDLNFKLDRLCRESALKTAATKQIKQKVFINFIPTSVYDPTYCLAQTVKWANQLEFDPANIIFEVVETENVKDQDHLKNILKFYRDQGFKIALDDVGEGYSGLNLLINLRPDIIKVDRNIIIDIEQDTFKQSIYKALYTVSKDHGIEVLAEGVETAQELEFIQSVGADYIQGYYFARPAAEPLRRLAKS